MTKVWFVCGQDWVNETDIGYCRRCGDKAIAIECCLEEERSDDDKIKCIVCAGYDKQHLLDKGVIKY